MKMRVVAIPLIAAICYGSPAMASPTTEEQMVRGRGARDRNGGGSGGDGARAAGGGGGERRAGGGERTSGTRGGDNRRDDGGQPRTAVTRRGDDDRRETSRADNDRRDNDRRDNDRRDNDRRDGERTGRNDRDNGQRVAVPRIGGRDGYYDRVPRIVVRNRPDIHFNFGSPYRNGYRYYTPAHYDRWARSYYRWSPVGYLPLSLIYGSIGFSNFGVYGGWGGAYPYYDPYAYSYGSPWRTSGYDVGGVRLKIRPREAQVFVDGHYAGLVDDFDGTFQSLRLEAGGHKIEIRMPGFADMELDVHVQPGRTITLAEVMQPRP
jgi:hypothetical protein